MGKDKQTPLQRKSSSVSQGINQSTKSQLKKISKIKITKKIPQVPLGNLYMRVDNVWINKGQFCRLCGILINDTIVIDKHRYICESLNKVREDD